MRGKAAFAHLEGLTQSVGAIVMLELFHHCEACGGISADKMPKAFFTRYEPGLTRGCLFEEASALSLHGRHVPLAGTGRRDG